MCMDLLWLCIVVSVVCVCVYIQLYIDIKKQTISEDLVYKLAYIYIPGSGPCARMTRKFVKRSIF